MQFFAILRDSFREAVDGFVIYVMLGLAALTILLVASVSFEPAPADKAFPAIVDRFKTVFQNRGTSKEQVGVRTGSGLATLRFPLPVEYKVSDVQRTDAGTGSGGSYKFRLTAQGGDPNQNPSRRRMGGPARPAAPRDNTDWFRFVVAAWSQQRLRELNVQFDPETGLPILGKGEHPPAGDGPAPLNVTIPDISPEELAAVTPEMMADFLKNQFALHAAMDQVSVRLVDQRGGGGPGLPAVVGGAAGGAAAGPPEYVFEVETKGGSSVRGWPHTTKIFFGAFTVSEEVPLGLVLLLIQDTLVNGIGAAVTLLVSVILTAFFIPNLIRKGSLDLTVAKPISRAKLLLYKYIGGLTFIFLISGATIGGVWVVLGIRSGYWNPEFLTVIPVLTFTFAILYSLSVLIAILTRSAIAAILITALFMFFLYAVGKAKTIIDLDRANSPKEAQKADDPGKSWWEKIDWPKAIADGLNNCLPRYKDLDKLTSKLLSDSLLSPANVRMVEEKEYPSWGSAVGVSLGFIGLMLLLSYWRFATRDG